jgi:peptidyl-prolyl cis-trans isomerase D
MLKILRKHSKHWLIGLVVGAIVVVFIFWGMGSMRSSPHQELARVYGEPIPLTTFYQYAALMAKKSRFRRNLSEEESKTLREGVPDNLIRLTLLTETAKRLGLTASDAEVQAAIIRDPAFQQDGVFEPRLYEMFIGRGKNREAEKVAYEKWLRQQILAAKALENIASFAKISETELQEYFRLAKEAVQVDYLVLSPETYLSRVKPSEEELKEYYDKHQAEFRIPEKAKVRYLLLRPQDFAKQAEISPKDVDEYVKEHKGELLRPQAIRVRELFVPLPAKADADKKKEVKQKAEELWKQARQGQDFAQLAKSNAKNDAARKQAGELESVSRGKKSEAWEKTAFALTPGEVGLAQTGAGYYLIKLEAVQEKEPLPEAEAKALALEKLQERKGRQWARDEAKRLQGETATTPFLEVAKKSQRTPIETPFFTQTEPIPDLGAVKSFNQEAFSLKTQEVGLAEVPQGYVVMQAMGRQAAVLPPFEEAKDKVRQAVARREAQKLADKEAGELLNRLRQGESLAKVAAQAALPVKDSGYFTRVQGFLRQPLAEPLTSAAFLLSEKQPYPDKPIAWQGKYYLPAYKNRKLPTPKEFQDEREILESRFLDEKRQILLDAWFKQEWQRAQVSKPRQGS